MKSQVKSSQVKSILAFSIGILLLGSIITCSNNNEPNSPCKDGICLTDAQLAFFSGHISNLDTKKELYEATTLDLSNKSITSLDTGIFNNLTNLNSVNLTGNYTCIVDKADVGLADGVTLTLPPLNEDCLTDEQVTFFNRHISSLDTKEKLYEATILDLSNKSITSLEAGIFNNLIKLTWLSLNNNDLPSIPTEIGNLTNLTTLSLDNNALTSIPTEIGNLTNLTDLYLRNNQLASIPDGIFTKLTNLTTLLLKSSGDSNMFDCTGANYSTWGLDPTSLPGSFLCNN